MFMTETLPVVQGMPKLMLVSPAIETGDIVGPPVVSGGPVDVINPLLPIGVLMFVMKPMYNGAPLSRIVLENA